MLSDAYSASAQHVAPNSIFVYRIKMILEPVYIYELIEPHCGEWRCASLVQSCAELPAQTVGWCARIHARASTTASEPQMSDHPSPLQDSMLFLN